MKSFVKDFVGIFSLGRCFFGVSWVRGYCDFLMRVVLVVRIKGYLEVFGKKGREWVKFCEGILF